MSTQTKKKLCYNCEKERTVSRVWWQGEKHSICKSCLDFIDRAFPVTITRVDPNSLTKHHVSHAQPKSDGELQTTAPQYLPQNPQLRGYQQLAYRHWNSDYSSVDGIEPPMTPHMPSLKQKRPTSFVGNDDSATRHD